MPVVISVSPTSTATSSTISSLNQYFVPRKRLTREDDVEGNSQPRRQDRVSAPYARNCLLARRLIERGTRFVTLFLSTWDQHSNLDSQLATNTKISDQPVAALLQDLKERGLLDQTLVVWGVQDEPVHVHDLHATILHLFSFDHEELTYRFQGRDFCLTDVHGNVVKKLLA